MDGVDVVVIDGSMRVAGRVWACELVWGAPLARSGGRSGAVRVCRDVGRGVRVVKDGKVGGLLTISNPLGRMTQSRAAADGYASDIITSEGAG